MELKRGTPREAGLDPDRLDNAYGLLERWAAEGSVRGSAVAVARRGVLLESRGFGVRRNAAGSGDMPADGVFLVASVTKPVTATSLMILVERGLVALQDTVTQYEPAFTGGGREAIRLLHLLTHTSGLPDMLPENTALRQQHAPLPAFVERVCRTPLLFPAGQRISYQSMGTLMAAHVVETVSGMPLRDFYEQEICRPLRMASTALGIRDELEPRSAYVDIPRSQEDTDWHWNTDYWRRLGAPWGGMFSSAEDLVVLLQTFLNGGCYGDARILGSSTAAAMVRDQTSGMATLEEDARRAQTWGLGWRLSGWTAELGRPGTFGHSGATGTLVGADPHDELAWAIFTTQPGAPLQYVANAITGAVI